MRFKDVPEGHAVGRRADVVKGEVLGVTKAELEEVDGHEGQEQQARDREVQCVKEIKPWQGTGGGGRVL